MVRRMRLVATLMVSGWASVMIGQAADTGGKKDDMPPAKVQEELSLHQQILARRYKEFERRLYLLAKRLENSSRPEEREKAAIVTNALELARKATIENRFNKLIELLQNSQASSSQDVKQAIGDGELLIKNLQDVLRKLMEDGASGDREDTNRLSNLLKEVNRIIRWQKLLLKQTERGLDRDIALPGQEKVTSAARDVARAIDGKKPSSPDAKGTSKAAGKGAGQAAGKEKSSSPGQGQGKSSGKASDQGQGKGSSQGQGQGDGKGDDSQQAGGQQGGGRPLPISPSDPGRKRLQDAIDSMKKAIARIQENKPDEVAGPQIDAIDGLVALRNRLQALLKQKREEEDLRLLAKLQARCEKMLEMQIKVRQGTGDLDQAIKARAAKEPERIDIQKAQQLGDLEGAIVEVAVKAKELLQDEGTAVVFPVIFDQLSIDMKTVERRLASKTDTGTITQQIEDDIITTLKEMIAALKKAHKDRQSPPTPSTPGPQTPPRKPTPPPLVDELAELKMIKSLQLRVNARTRAYGMEYTGEQADAPTIKKELQNLADRQIKIYQATHDIAAKKND